MPAIPHTDLTVHQLCLGGNVFGWTADRGESFAVLDAYAAAGGNFVDTADLYAGGESEKIVGAWMAERGNHDDIVVATKMGMKEGSDNLRADTIRSQAEASLTSLGTDHIDLYYAHQDDEDTPVAETLGAYQRLIEAGKVRAIGASNLDAAQLAEALRVAGTEGLPRYQVLQPGYNLVDRGDLEGPLLELCRAEGLGVITYFSLAKGFLSGKYRSNDDLGKSQRGGAVSRYLTPRGFAILGALDLVAARHGATPAEVALAWVIAQPGVTAPIASATSLDQLASLVRATSLALDPDDLAALAAASA